MPQWRDICEQNSRDRYMANIRVRITPRRFEFKIKTITTVRRSDGRSEQSPWPDRPRTHMTALTAALRAGPAPLPQRLLSTLRRRRPQQSSVCDAHETFYAHARTHAHPRSAGRRDVRCPPSAFENDPRPHLRACVEIPARMDNRRWGLADPTGRHTDTDRRRPVFLCPPTRRPIRHVPGGAEQQQQQRQRQQRRPSRHSERSPSAAAVLASAAVRATAAAVPAADQRGAAVRRRVPREGGRPALRHDRFLTRAAVLQVRRGIPGFP